MEILRANLDDEQYEIARQLDENLLVLAPPGSGKTRLLTQSAAYAVRSTRWPIRALCLTFNVEATQEMRRRLAVPGLQCPRNRVMVANYHQLGAHLLSRWGHRLGLPRQMGLCAGLEQEALVREVISELHIPINAYNLRSAIEAQKTHRVADGTIAAQTLLNARALYDHKLRSRGLRDFADLILDATRLLRENPRLGEILHRTYPYVFVDEMQDTSRVQLDLLSELVGGDTRILAVADDDQMIYSWLDALPGNLEEYVRKFAAREASLTGNYRCPAEIVNLANRVIAQNTDRRKPVPMVSKVQRQGEIATRVGPNENSELQIVASEIQGSIDRGFAAEKIAVIAPHRFKFENLSSVLVDQGIDHVVIGSPDFSRKPVPRLVRLGLQALSAPSTELAVRFEDLKEVYAAATPGHYELFKEAVGVARELVGRRSFRALLNGLRLKPTGDSSGGRDVRVLGRMAAKADNDSPGLDGSSLSAMILYDWNRLESYALRAESAVHLLTGYGAKGLEYEVVILPFLNDGLVPYQRRGAPPLDWEEARRLFYVSMTRASHRLVLSRAADKPPSSLIMGLGL